MYILYITYTLYKFTWGGSDSALSESDVIWYQQRHGIKKYEIKKTAEISWF